MRILITGGAGYIGTELVYALANNNAIESITVYDNLSRGNFNLFLGKPVNSEKVKFVHGELLGQP
jgi:UDP-glucose 4-epimerase